MTVVAPRVGGDPTPPELGEAPPERMVNDEILASPLTRDPEFQERVAYWVNHWSTTAVRWFPEYLERMTWFADDVDSTLARKDLPPGNDYRQQMWRALEDAIATASSGCLSTISPIFLTEDARTRPSTLLMSIM